MSNSSTIVSSSNEYKDLDLSFKTHPLYGDVRPVTDVAAIKSSIKNILLTQRGERPFKPRFGCDLHKYLFEPADAITKSLIIGEIKYSIGEQEPRVRIDNITLEDYSERNAYAVTIEVTIINSQRQIELDLILERLR